MFSIFSTFGVTKLDKSKVFKLLQSQNIFPIFIAFNDLKLSKCVIVSKLEQPKNIFSIVIALPVLKLLKSRVVKEEQLEKIFFII